jgi:hypothetical protein
MQQGYERRTIQAWYYLHKDSAMQGRLRGLSHAVFNKGTSDVPSSSRREEGKGEGCYIRQWEPFLPVYRPKYPMDGLLLEGP